jgi:hypothetical protein
MIIVADRETSTATRKPPATNKGPRASRRKPDVVRVWAHNARRSNTVKNRLCRKPAGVVGS